MKPPVPSRTGDATVPSQTAIRLGWGLSALSVALVVFFFVRSQTAPPGFFSGGFEFFVAALFAMFAAVALVSLVLARFLQPKSDAAALAAIVVGIVSGAVPPALVVTFPILEYLG